MLSPNSYAELIDEMTLALTANIEYLKKDGSSQVRLKNGKLTNVLESGYQYDFQLERVQDIDPEAEIELRIGNSSTMGKVTAITDESVQVLVDEHFGDEIASAMLIIASYFLLEKLKTHLLSMKNGEVGHSNIAEKVFKLQQAEVTLDDRYAKSKLLDDSQYAAVKKTLGSDVSFIWGPPGTGKSKTISSLVEVLVERGLSVLLIAHTNAATDSVMEKVVELAEDKKLADYYDGKFLRIGKKINEKLKTKLVVPEKIMEEKARPILLEIAALKSDLAKLNAELEITNKAEHYEGVIAKAKQQIADYEDEIISVERKSGEGQASLASQEEKLAFTVQKIEDFQSRGKLSRLFSGTNLDSLTKERVEHARLIMRIKDKLSSLEGDRQLAQSEIGKHQSLITRISQQISAMQLPANFDAKKVRQKVKDYDEQVKALEKQIEELAETLLLEAKVIATTLTQTYTSSQLLSRKYDIVILDEASMAPLPAVASVAGIAQKKICLVGDFFQLPPIAKHKVDAKNKSDQEVKLETELVDTWLKQDIFGYVGIENAVTKGNKPEAWLSQLKTQYRMHPDISYLINELVYGKNKEFKLENGDNTHGNGLLLLGQEPLVGQHVGIVDTASLGSIPVKSDSGSWYNLPHAIAAIELAKQAIESGYTKIGIISAYRAQVNLLNQILVDELKDKSKLVEADTVHRFQGGAKQIIIFDVTVHHSMTMYDDMKEGGDDAKLINVAFSRAEEKCIILTDVKQVEKKHSSSSLIKNALAICEKQSRPVIDARSLIDDYYADDRTEHWLAQLAGAKDIQGEIENALLVDERDFYPLFLKDVLGATKEVIIQSAFITTSRLNTLLPVFQLLLRRGVRIFVMTRVPWEHNGVMRAQSEEGQRTLEKLGVVILPFVGNIHQKYAIVDRALMWDGSLNILSQRDSKEVMRRCVGKKTVNQYMDFMRLSKNIGELGSNNLKHCTVCTLPGSYMWTKKVRGKMWTFCLTGNHSASMPPKTQADRDARTKELRQNRQSGAKLREKIKLNGSGEMLCPTHSRSLMAKTGRFGDYWECPDSMECHLTVSTAQRNKLLAKA